MAISSTVIVAPAAASAGSGAPTDATYITQTANGSLSAEQALSTLSTGLVKVTTGTGVLSTATSGTDYAPANGGGLTLIEKKEQSSGATTAWTFSSLSDAAYTGLYVLEFAINNSTVSSCDYTLTVNGGTAPAVVQRMGAFSGGNTIPAAVTWMASVGTGEYAMGTIKFFAKKKAASWKRQGTVLSHHSTSTNAVVNMLSFRIDLTTTEVTAMELTASIASGIGQYSEARLYYMKEA